MIIVLISIVHNLSWGQYTYFETTSSQSLNGWAENLGALELFEGRYFTWGIGIGTLQGEQEDRYFIQEYDSLGQYVDGLNIYLPNEFLYTGVTNTFQKAIGEEAFYAMGTKVDTISTKGYVMKVSSDLDTLWTKEYTMYEPNTQIDASTPTNDGGLYLAGSYGVAVGERGTYIAEIDAQGNLLWHQSIHEPNEGVFRNRYISAIPNGFIVSGTEGGGGDAIGHVELLAENGNLNWSLINPKPILGAGTMNHLVRNNGEVITFQHVRYQDYPDISDPYWAYALLRISTVDLNSSVFSEEYNYFTDNEMIRGGARKALELEDESLILAGGYEKENIGGSLPQVSYILKLNSSYEMDWFTELAFNDCAGCLNVIWDMVEAPDGGYTMAGYFQDPNSADPYTKTWLVKVDACGDIEYNGCWPVSAEELEIPDLKFEAYPNPAKDYVAIEFQNWREELILSLVDMNGKIIFSKRVNPTGIELIDTQSFASGIYHVIARGLSTGKTTSTKVEIQH